MYKKKLQNEAIKAFSCSWPLLYMSICLTFLLPLPTIFVRYRLFPSILMEVLYGLPSLLSVDSIPFLIAIVLFVIVLIAAVIRLGGYFLPRSNQPLQLIISIISLVASSLLLSFVSLKNGKSNSPYLQTLKLKILGSYQYQIVYICLLIINISIVGIYEVYTQNNHYISYTNTLISGIVLANYYDHFPTA